MKFYSYLSRKNFPVKRKQHINMHMCTITIQSLLAYLLVVPMCILSELFGNEFV